MSERGVLNLDLNLTVDSEMKYGLELRTAEYTSLIEEQLLSAECSIVGKRMNAVDGEKASYAADKVTFEHSIPCGFDTIQRINTNAIRLNFWIKIGANKILCQNIMGTAYRFICLKMLSYW